MRFATAPNVFAVEGKSIFLQISFQFFGLFIQQNEQIFELHLYFRFKETASGFKLNA